MASRVAGKIKLQSVDELLCVPETAANTIYIDIKKIRPFKEHPFKVLDDDKMQELVESIKESGVLCPVLVRPDENGGYEMVSGHRRMHASGLAGLEKIPAIVKEMTDEEATILMVDANIQREELLPSERAFAFKMKMDAIRRQGARTDLMIMGPNVSKTDEGTSRQNVGKLGKETLGHKVLESEDRTSRQNVGKSEKETLGHKVPKLESKTSRQNVGKLSADLVGETVGIGARQIQRYIRLTYLIPELLEFVDIKKLGFAMAVDISFFDESVQKWLYEYIKENGFLKQCQVDMLKQQKNLENMTQYVVISILNDSLPKKNVSAKVSFTEKKLNKYFPNHYSAKMREEVILKLLEQWKAEQDEA